MARTDRLRHPARPATRRHFALVAAPRAWGHIIFNILSNLFSRECMKEPSYSIEPLFQPWSLGSMRLRSRIVMSAMTRCFSPGGIPGQNVADYYRRRAEAGVGLVVTEGTGIDHPSALGHGSMGEENVPVLHGDAALAGWKNVIAAVHAAGGLIVPQLWHMGVIRVAGTGPFPNAPSSRPSGLWGPPGKSAAMAPEYMARQSPPPRPM